MSLTYAGMQRRLWIQAHAQNITITLRGEHKTLWGCVDVRFGERRVRINATKADDIIRTLIHELIHDAFRVELAPWGRIEEDIVLLAEQRVWAFLSARPALLERWRGFVSKLKEGK